MLFRLFLTLTASGLFHSPVIAQWETLNIDAVSGQLGEITFNKDFSLGYALLKSDNEPHLVQTNNQGKSWAIKRFFFTDWRSTFTHLKSLKNGDVLLLNKTKVCILDTSSLLLDTIYDLEENFSKTVNTPFRNPEMVFLNDNVGYILSHNIFKTIDGGYTWKREGNVFSELHRSFTFIDDSNGFFLGLTEANKLKLHVTKDGGKTWNTVGSDLLSLGGSFVKFVSSTDGFLAGEDNCIYITSDGGKTWQKQYCVDDGKRVGRFQALEFISPQVGWFLLDGRSGIFKTVDGGKSFYKQTLENDHTQFNRPRSMKVVTPELIFVYSRFNFRSSNQGGSPLLSTNKPKSTTLEKPVLYPNPVSNYFQITTQFEEPINVEILDVLGKKQMEFKNYSSEEFVDVSILPMGIYFAKLANGKTIKFLKE